MLFEFGSANVFLVNYRVGQLIFVSSWLQWVAFFPELFKLIKSKNSIGDFVRTMTALNIWAVAIQRKSNSNRRQSTADWKSQLLMVQVYWIHIVKLKRLKSQHGERKISCGISSGRTATKAEEVEPRSTLHRCTGVVFGPKKTFGWVMFRRWGTIKHNSRVLVLFL